MQNQSKGKEFIFFADLPPKLTQESLREYANCGFNVYLIKNRKDIVVGEFQNAAGEYAYMVVNFADPSMLKNNSLEIDFKGKKNITLVNKGQTFNFIEEELSIVLQPGDGAFIIVSEIKNKK